VNLLSMMNAWLRWVVWNLCSICWRENFEFNLFCFFLVLPYFNFLDCFWNFASLPWSRN
jgi:hypothetical protein